MIARLRLALVAVALLAGAAAALVGDPRPPLDADEVSAVQLAEWLRAHRAQLWLLDTRDAAAMQRQRLPGALAAAELDAVEASDAATVVVYADRDSDAAVVAELRRRLFPRPLLRLHGGLDAWNAEVLFPLIRADASARQRQRFAARAELSRYFGGTPRVLEPGASRAGTRSRRGC